MPRVTGEQVIQLDERSLPIGESALREVRSAAAASEARPRPAARRARTTSDPDAGRSRDPVRVYLREMGRVSLLTREGEVEIAKRIESAVHDEEVAVERMVGTQRRWPRFSAMARRITTKTTPI